MTKRSVAVELVLQATGYMSGMDKASKKTRELGSEAEKLAQKREAFNQLGAAATAVGVAAGIGVGIAVSKFAQFDQQMSYVQARTHETAGNMDLLRDAALDAGARTVYSATEAAAAIEELAAAGISTKDILAGGLDASLDLAAAGGMAVAEAAGIAATALKVFKLEGEDMSHVADLLAAGAGKAMGEVSDLGAALSQGAQVAQATGLSIEETTAALSAFASQGLLGSDAGTSFKAMLQRLTPQSAEAQRHMDELGISAYDAAGQFIGLEAFAGNLETALRDLTPEQRNAALATIFGSDAVRAANVLYTEGEAGIREWTEAVNDQGYAAETAAMRLDNLLGDVEALGGAFDTALIQSGSGANEALRALVQTGTGAVEMFTQLPEPVQEAAVYLGLAATGVGLLSGAALLGAPRIAEFRTALATTNMTMRGLSIAAGGATIGLAAVIGIIAAVSTAQAEATAQSKAYADTLEKGTQNVTTATREMVVQQLRARDSMLWWENSSAFDAAEKLGISLQLVTDAAMGNSSAIQQLDADILAASESFRGSEDDYKAYESWSRILTDAVAGEADSLERAAEMARQSETAHEEAAESTKTSAEAYLEAASGVDELKSQLDELIAKIAEANGMGQDAITTNASYQAALAGIAEQATEAGTSLDQNTVAGSANAAMLADVAGKAQAAAEAQYQVDLSAMSAKDAAEKYAATLGAQRQAFIDSATGAGYNADEVNRLADQIFGLPNEKQVEVLAQTNAARSAVDDFIRDYAGKSFNMYVNAIGAAGGGGRAAQQNAMGNLYVKGKAKEFAAGGFASGIYPFTPGGIHKFAEAYDEAYISLDPARRDRSIDIWAETGRMLGAWMPASTSAVMPAAAPGMSLDGASITGTLEIGGDGLGRIINGRISTYDRDQRARRDMGSRK